MDTPSGSMASPDFAEAAGALEAWSPEVDPGDWDLEILLNAPVLKSLMKDFAKITCTATAILDLKGKVLVAVGWQDICTKYHRINTCTSKECTESDLYLAGHVERGNYVAYKCKNGLWDVVTPLYLGDRHMGNIYAGQFFYVDEAIDRTFFECRAERFGFDKAAYLEALDHVPRFSRAQVKQFMDFLVKFTDLVSRLTLSNLRSATFIQEQARSASALRISEAELREKRAMLAMILDTIPQAVFWKDLEGRYLGCNRAFAQTVGLPDPSMVLGNTDFDLPWPREEAEAYRADDQAVLQSRQPKLHIIEPLQQADGRRRHIETSKVPLLDVNGTPLAVLGIFEDITERKQAEEDRARLQRELQQVQKMESLGNLAGGVAHDMNNVLGAILGLATAQLDAHLPGSPTHQVLETIIKAAERGGRMVKSLLSFSRKTAAEEKPLDLNKLLQEEVSLLERTTLAKVQIKMDLATGLRPMRGDESALAHAFMNLCINAVDALSQGGTLILRTRNVDPAWIEVQVEDTGAGMSPEVLERAMDPFFTTKEVGKGTGLGLSMVYSTVKAHGGRIEVQSEVGKGTCVTVVFPACTPESTRVESPTEDDSGNTAGGLLVLVIDDDDLIQAAIGTVLKALGFRTLSALSGEEGLAKVEAGERPDVVILDMNMPGMGGVGTLPRLRALLPSLPVLLATGRVDQTALDLVMSDSHTILLSKPFALAEMKAKLKAILKQAGLGNGGGA